jgi:hypothetical protein
VNGQLIWFLLRHEFRLRQRDPKTNLRNQAIDCLSMYLFLSILISLFIFMLMRWSLHPLEIKIHFFSNPLPDIFPVIAGVIINILLISENANYRRINPRILGNEFLDQNLYDTPISSHTLLASYLLNNIVRHALTGNIYLFPTWIGLSVFYGKPEFIISLPITVILAIACQESLFLWKRYISIKWFRGNLAKLFICFFRVATYFALFVFLISIKFLEVTHILSFNLIKQWFRCLWLPGRVTLLDPLPTIGLLLTSIGLVWFTIEMLHRPLIKLLQTPKIESRQNKTHYRKVKFQSNLIYVLIQREWRHHRVPLMSRFIYSIFLCAYPCIALSMSSTHLQALSFILAMAMSFWLSLLAWVNSLNFAAEDSLLLLGSDFSY